LVVVVEGFVLDDEYHGLLKDVASDGADLEVESFCDCDLGEVVAGFVVEFVEGFDASWDEKVFGHG